VAVALVAGLAVGAVAGSFVGGAGEGPELAGTSADSGEVTVTVEDGYRSSTTVGVYSWEGGEEGAVEQGGTREFTGPASEPIIFWKSASTFNYGDPVVAMYPSRQGEKL